MNGADLAVLVVPFLDGSSNRVEAGTDLEVVVLSSMLSSMFNLLWLFCHRCCHQCPVCCGCFVICVVINVQSVVVVFVIDVVADVQSVYVVIDVQSVVVVLSLMSSLLWLFCHRCPVSCGCFCCFGLCKDAKTVIELLYPENMLNYDRGSDVTVTSGTRHGRAKFMEYKEFLCRKCP